MEKRVLIFTHTDLDGIGVQIIGIKYAEMVNMPYKVFRCNYGEINDVVLKELNKCPEEEIGKILIGDISVNEEVAGILHSMFERGVDIILRDHHATAEWLNKYPWAYVNERVYGIPYCGTYLLAREFLEIFEECRVFISTVDSWDTWKWKQENNQMAKRLNALFKILGSNDFVEYIMNLNMKEVLEPADLFDEHANILVDAQEKMILKTARNCENNMWISELKVNNCYLKCGIIFCNNDLSNVADYILSNHPDIDLLAIYCLPRTISLRTQKDLPVPLGDIAKQLTGAGGGHPHAAGAVISKNQFKDIFLKSTKILSNKITFTDLRLNQED